MEYLTEEEKSYYYDITTISNTDIFGLNVINKLRNNTYYILGREDEHKNLIYEFLDKCENLIHYLLHQLDRKIFTRKTDAMNFLLGSIVGDTLNKSWFSVRLKYYENETTRYSPIRYEASLLRRVICGHQVCFIDPYIYISDYKSIENYSQEWIVRNKFTNFLLLNNLAKRNQILHGTTKEIVSNLHYLTTLRPLFDYTWQKKPWSSKSKDHNPVVIKWLTPEQQQDKALIETLVNEYRLERL